MDRVCSGYVVVDAGHGGADPGASGNGIIEKDVNLKISQYMYNRFKELGIPVAMTRTTDETLTHNQRTSRIKNAFGNNPNVTVLANHINSGGGDGAEVIYALRNNNTLANMILNEISKTGQNIRRSYQRRSDSNPNQDYYFIHRETGNTEPVLIEYGFLDSKGDDVSQIKNNWQNMAEAVVKAVAEYKGCTYRTPSGSTPGITTYTVERGDSLYAIANRYGSTVSAIQSLNNLTSTTLQIGQVLRIPVSTPSTPTTPTTPSPGTYTVKKGDSLYSIAQKHNTTVSELQRLNNLTSTLLNIGQVLNVPSEEVVNNNDNEVITENVYEVKPGDSLWKIANMFNTNVDELMALNNLSSTILTIGQKLAIPGLSTTGGTTTHTVQPGDTLYSIAKRYNTTVDNIMNQNNLTSTTLSVGQQLIV